MGLWEAAPGGTGAATGLAGDAMGCAEACCSPHNIANKTAPTKNSAVENLRMSLPVGCSTKRRCFLLTLPWMRGRVGSHRAKQDARRGGVKSWNEISPPSFHSRRPRERAALVSTPPGEG